MHVLSSPRWWNGRHWGLKIPWSQGRAGSSPALGIFLEVIVMIEFYPQSIYYPREAVETKLERGELQVTEKRLFEFAERHRDAIWEAAQEDIKDSKDPVNPSDDILINNLKAFLLSIGSLHPAYEMGEMIKEIKKEIWYQNENQEKSASEVADNWKELYAGRWREARMFEAFILIEHRSADLIFTLRTTGLESI